MPEEITKLNNELQKFQARIELLENLVFTFMRTNKYAFSKNILMQDGRNIEVNTGTGTRIGTATGQKLAFFNSTPVVQQAANADTSGATLAALETEVNQLKAVLRTFGFIAT